MAENNGANGNGGQGTPSTLQPVWKQVDFLQDALGRFPISSATEDMYREMKEALLNYWHKLVPDDSWKWCEGISLGVPEKAAGAGKTELRLRLYTNGVPDGGLAAKLQAFGIKTSLFSKAKLDLVETGEITGSQQIRTNPSRPAAGGVSISGSAMGMGTLGCLCRGRSGNDVYILSAAHVLSNTGVLPVDVYQPGTMDGVAVNPIALLEAGRCMPLVAGQTHVVDCAAARVVGDVNAMVRPDLLHVAGGAANFTALTGHMNATEGMSVCKTGRTTHLTEGVVTSLCAVINPVIQGRRVAFENQIEITRAVAHKPFCDAGDSGAIVWEKNSRKAVGLLFAKSDRLAFANHIGEVLSRLDVDIMVAAPAAMPT